MVEAPHLFFTTACSLLRVGVLPESSVTFGIATVWTVPVIMVVLIGVTAPGTVDQAELDRSRRHPRLC